MGVPTFVQASAGNAFTTGASNVSSLTGCVAGNVVFCHILDDGTGADWSVGAHVNTQTIAGGTSNIDFVHFDAQVGATAVAFHVLLIGRVTANGTVSATFSIGGSGDDLFIRWYEFAGELQSAVTLATLIEEGIETSDSDSSLGTGTTVSDQDVTTNGSDRLAMNFIAVNANTTISAFTGETGGDWTEATAEFASATGTGGMLSLQTASMAAAGIITGGSATLGTSAAWGVTGLALIGTPGQTVIPDADLATGGWTTAPLFSKLNDGSDATVITATAS